MVFTPKDEIQDNVRQVLDTIGQAVHRAGRSFESVKLLAVSKTVPADRIRWALEAGVSRLGENRVQEGQSKKTELAAYRFEFHLIGPLQKNKVNKAVATFDWIETVDSLDLALKIDRACASIDKIMPVLLEVNLGMEPTKSGILEGQIVEVVERCASLQHLSLRGLMAIPPFEEVPERSRHYFRRLRQLAEMIKSRAIANVEIEELSMGMSHDYPIAIEEGATIVRLGTAIFGERQPLNP